MKKPPPPPKPLVRPLPQKFIENAALKKTFKRAPK